MQKRIVLIKGFMKDHVNKNVCRSYCHPFLTRECAHRNERVIVIWANCHSLARSGDQLWTCKLESVVQVNRNFAQNGRKKYDGETSDGVPCSFAHCFLAV